MKTSPKQEKKLRNRSMITDNQIDLIKKIRDIVWESRDKEAEEESEIEESMFVVGEMCQLLDSVVENMKKAPLYYRELKSDKYYHCECEDCGWFGSSEFLKGGHAIGDSGDYDDLYCPVCGSTDLN